MKSIFSEAWVEFYRVETENAFRLLLKLLSDP